MQRHQAGASLRAIAEDLGISRGAVRRALARVQAQRDGQAAPLPRPRRAAASSIAFEPILKELLARYPNLTVERALQELQAARLQRRLHGRAAARAALAAAARAGAGAAL